MAIQLDHFPRMAWSFGVLFMLCYIQIIPVFAASPDLGSDLRVDQITTNSAKVSWTKPATTTTFDSYEVTINPPGPNTTSVAVNAPSPVSDITGLTAGKEYTVTVRTKTGTAEGSPKTVTFNAKPKPVTGITLTVSGAKISVTWPAGVGSTQSEYKVKSRAVFVNPSSTWSEVAVKHPKLKAEIDFKPGEKYEVEVYAISGDQTSDVATGSLVTAPSPPNSASVNKAAATTTSIEVTWTAPSTASYFVKYVIKYAKEGTTDFKKMDATTTELKKTISLESGVKYIIKVFTETKENKLSDSSADTTGTVKPLPVTIGTITSSGAKMTVPWTAGVGSTQSKYKVRYRPVFVSSSWNQVSVNHPTLKAEIVIKPGEKYEVEVYAISGDQTSDVATGSLVTAPFPPNSASVTKAATTTTSIEVTWTAPSTTSYFIKYVVKYAKDGTNNFKAIDATSSELKKSIPNLEAGVKYIIKVFTETRENKLSDSSADTTGTVKPLPVTGVTLTLSGVKMTVKWTAGAQSTQSKYKVEYQAIFENPSSTWSEVSVNHPTVEAEIVIKPGEKYEVKVYAISGDQSSDVATGSLVTAPFPPSSASVNKATTTTTSIEVTWTAPSTTSYFVKYVVKYAKDGTNNFKAIDATSSELKKSIPNLDAGVKYIVKVFTETQGNKLSDTSADTTGTVKPQPVQKASIKFNPIGTKTATATWTKVSGVLKEYRVTIKPSGPAITPAVVPGTTDPPKTEFTNLTPGVKYTVTVTTVSGTVDGDSATAEFITKPLPVTIGKIISSGAKMTVPWTANVGSTQSKYKVRYRPVFENPSSTWSETSEDYPKLKAEIVIKPGEKYEVEVYAISGDQTSDVATGSRVTAPFPPASASVNKAAATTTTIEVTWTAPSTTSYFIKYVVKYAKDGTTDFKEMDASTSELKKTIPSLEAGVKYIINVFTKTKENKLSDKSTDTTGTVKPNCDVKVTDLSDETNKLKASYSKSSLVFTDYKFVIANGPSPAILPRKKDQEPRNLVYTTGVEPGHRYPLKAYCVSNGIESDPIDFHLDSVPASITRVKPITSTPDSITMTVHKPLGLASSVTVTCEGPSAGDNNGCTFTKNRVFGKDTVVVTYDKLESHETYKFTFQVTSYDKKSQIYTVTKITLQGRPSAPDRFTATSTSATTVELQWSTPVDPNGEVSKYVVKYTGKYKTNPALGKPDHTDNATFDVDPKIRSYTETLRGLRGGYSYDFTIYGMTSYPGPGENAYTAITMPVDAPTLLDDAIAPESNGTKSETKIFATFKKSFNESNGPILYYSIIVAQSLKDAVLSGPSPKDDAILPWNKVEDSDTWPPYMAIKKCDIFDTAKNCDGSPPTSRKKRSISSDTVVVTIGLQSCENTKSGDYCNGPLKPGSNYQLRLRGYTGPNKYYDAPYSEKIPTAPKDQTGMIVGVSVGLLVLLGIASGVAIYFFLKYRKAEKEKRYEEEAQPETTPVDRSRPVRLTDFPGHHEFMHADTDFRFAEEYEDLKDVGITQSYTVSELPYNRVKNRFTNILPYNWSRVKLSPVEDIEGTDYINANYIPGFTSKREYVACQGPLDSTMDDFWRMIWEQNCQAIVMLTRCMENGRQKCAHYWPEDTDPVIYGDIEVVILNETQNTDFAITQLRMTKGGESRRICHFHFLVWPDFSAPEVSGPLLRFLRTFRDRVGYDNSRPICVHCSAGVGRSGTFITLDRLTQHMKEHDYVDIFGTVYEMRLHRRYMVQTEQQYIFIHKAILEIISDRVKPQAPSPEGHENEAFEAKTWNGDITVDDEGITLEVLS